MMIDVSQIKSPFPIGALDSSVFQNTFIPSDFDAEPFSQVLLDAQVAQEEREMMMKEDIEAMDQRMITAELMGDHQFQTQEGQRFLSGQLSHLIPIENPDVQRLANSRHIEGLQLSSQGQGKSFQDSSRDDSFKHAA